MIPAIMQWLAGTWFVIASDAPLWTKGDKTRPAINYTVQQRNNTHRMLDEVRYVKRGKTRSIKGYDKADGSKKSAFVWRGKGLLFFAVSKWQVRMQDTAGNWAVIAYSKMVFTPEGVDVLCRAKALDEPAMQYIIQLMKKDSLLARHVPMLKMIKH